MLLLSTWSLTWYGLHRVFQFAKESWYHGLDISLWMLNYDLWDEVYILNLSKEFSFPVCSITAPGKDMSQKKLEKIMLIAETLGTKVVTFSPPHLTDTDTKWFANSLPLLKKNKEISICVQNVESKFLFFVIPEYRNATLEKIKAVTGNTTLDLVAIDMSSTMDIMRAQSQLWASIRNIYFADKNASQRGIIPGCAGGWLSHLPLESFLMKLKSIEYSWYITLKVSPKELWVWDQDLVLKNLVYVKQYIVKHFDNFKNS